jgi:hypothetical protein
MAFAIRSCSARVDASGRLVGLEETAAADAAAR